MITSFIPGRVRIREARFRDPETCAAVQSLLEAHPCVTKVSANPKTGGILIEYDPEKLEPREALEALEVVDPEGAAWLREQLCPEEEMEDCGCGETDAALPPARPAVNPEAAEYVAMTGAFVVCASSAALRAKGWHVYSGLALAGLTLQHAYKYRKRLLNYFKTLVQVQ